MQYAPMSPSLAHVPPNANVKWFSVKPKCSMFNRPHPARRLLAQLPSPLKGVLATCLGAHLREGKAKQQRCKPFWGWASLGGTCRHPLAALQEPVELGPPPCHSGLQRRERECRSGNAPGEQPTPHCCTCHLVGAKSWGSIDSRGTRYCAHLVPSNGGSGFAARCRPPGTAESSSLNDKGMGIFSWVPFQVPTEADMT